MKEFVHRFCMVILFDNRTQNQRIRESENQRIRESENQRIREYQYEYRYES